MKKRGSGFSLVLCHSFVKGDSYPEICAQHDAEGEGFPFVVAEAGAEAGNVYIYPLGMKDNKQETFIHSFKMSCNPDTVYSP
jgi:hypothetical protein